MPRRPVITLITDFGATDHFVGAIKGVILNINPEAVIVDICHQVGSFDVFDAAFTLAQSYSFYPSDTIHLVVVDPGVGSTRRPILVRSMNYVFVAPDNGVLSLVYEREEAVQVRHITSSHYFLSPISETFHGRDVFAPVAGWLSKSVETDKFGDLITDFVKFTPPKSKRLGDNLIKGVALKIDKFGNIITNIRPEDVPRLFSENPPHFKMVINQVEVTRLYSSYTMSESSEPFAIVGSSGYIEISANRGSAAKALNASRGVEVGLLLDEAPSPGA